MPDERQPDKYSLVTPSGVRRLELRITPRNAPGPPIHMSAQSGIRGMAAAIPR